MDTRFKEIQITYQNQTLISKLSLLDQVYAKFQQVLKTPSDELVIIINNDYNQIVPRNQQSQELKNQTNLYAYNIKDLLKEKIQNNNQIVQVNNLQREEQQINKDNNVQISTNITISQEFGSEMDNEQSIFESVKSEIRQLCVLCQKIIISKAFQTNCYHHYHQECFQDYIIKQIENNNTMLSCVCKKKIEVKLIKNQISNINDKIDVFFNNQLKIIYKEYEHVFK